MEYVAFGTSGGIMAMTNTKYIYPDGKVCGERKTLYGPPMSVNCDNIDVDAVNKLYQMFTDDICSKTHNVPASFCHFIKIKKNDVEYEWVYIKPPTFLQNINDELNKMFEHNIV
jgi:hypothetical protein